MDTRKAFLEAAQSTLIGIHDLARFRIVGNTTYLVLYEVNAANPKKYAKTKFEAIRRLKLVGPDEFSGFYRGFVESSIVLAFSILDSFISEAEEVLFLHNPSSMGENAQVTLGKVINSESIEILVHEIVRKRVRNKGQWSLKNRLEHLQKSYGIESGLSEEDIEFVSKTRNEIVHDRRAGSFEIRDGKLSYRTIDKAQYEKHYEVDKYLNFIIQMLNQIYLLSCKELGINRKSKLHRDNIDHFELISSMWPANVGE